MKDIIQEARILISDTGTDIYLPKFAILWYLVMEDFKIERECIDAIDCLEGDRSKNCWENFLEYDIDLVEFDLFAPSDYLTDCLKMGYLPGDRIAVVVSQPWYTEDDVQFQCEVIKVVSGKIEIHQLEKHINKIFIFEGECKRSRAAKLARAHVDTDKMYLVRERYFAPDQSLWDDMVMPRAVCIELRSHHLFPLQNLASGSSEAGSYREASEELVKQIEKELPHVAPLYEKLPHRAW